MRTQLFLSVRKRTPKLKALNVSVRHPQEPNYLRGVESFEKHQQTSNQRTVPRLPSKTLCNSLHHKHEMEDLVSIQVISLQRSVRSTSQSVRFIVNRYPNQSKAFSLHVYRLQTY